MQCLTPEQIVSYLRGNGGDPRAVEAHVRDCPACGMELLLARETLSELKPARIKPATRKMAVVRPRTSWVPWAAAAAVFVVAILLVLQLGKPSKGPSDMAGGGRPQPRPEAPKAPELKPETPKPEPRPEAPRPEPRPEAPTPKPETPKPEVPKPEMPKPEVPKPETPKPETPKPETPKPEPRPTIPEKAIVARVTQSVGGAAGRTILAGDTFTTGRQEFASVALDGYGQLWFRESSKVEIGTGGEIHLHEGAMLARIDSGRRMGLCKTPTADIELHAPMFHLEASKQGTELSVLDGRAAVGSVTAKGPSMLAVKPGKPAEAKPLEPGFLAWLPDKLAAKKFTGWVEGRAASPMVGFKSGDGEMPRAAVQIDERASLALKTPLPYKGKFHVWLRVRQYAGQKVNLGLMLNGQAIPNVLLEGTEAKPWRWVQIVVNSDKADLVLSAVAGNPYRKNDERRAFPIILDGALVTTDAKFVPERAPEDMDPYTLVLEDPAK
jgi:hypothetical protein